MSSSEVVRCLNLLNVLVRTEKNLILPADLTFDDDPGRPDREQTEKERLEKFQLRNLVAGIPVFTADALC